MNDLNDYLCIEKKYGILLFNTYELFPYYELMNIDLLCT